MQILDWNSLDAAGRTAALERPEPLFELETDLQREIAERLAELEHDAKNGKSGANGKKGNARGEQLKVFNVQDGHGIKLLQAAGLTVAIISGRKSAAVTRRCRELGIRHVYQGISDKSAALDTLLTKLQLTGAQLAVVGDDTPDIPMLVRAGRPRCKPVGLRIKATTRFTPISTGDPSTATATSSLARPTDAHRMDGKRRHPSKS
jgi:YrbI family 3-deoxy-D-manno-octulosonate 8-phosphate phosphatase